jgi:hypothetical protein
MSSWWRRVAGKSMKQRGMEEAPENSKESSHSAHANGMNERNAAVAKLSTLRTCVMLHCPVWTL